MLTSIYASWCNHSLGGGGTGGGARRIPQTLPCKGHVNYCHAGLAGLVLTAKTGPAGQLFFFIQFTSVLFRCWV